MARNKIRRSLASILDPHPSSIETRQLWEYFRSQCAYCGVALQRSERTGHLDHVLASSVGGTNSIHNHVLACARCNGDEKREEDWASFLAKKAESPKIAAARRHRIDAWLSSAPEAVVDPSRAAEATAIINQAVASFDIAVAKLRALRGGI